MRTLLTVTFFVSILLFGVQSEAEVVPTTTIVYQSHSFSDENLWTSSIYSYGYNGIVDNDHLRIGGWGDTYVTYLRFAHMPAHCSNPNSTDATYEYWCITPLNWLEGLPHNHIHSATLQLYATAQSANPTNILLGTPSTDWHKSWQCATSSNIDGNPPISSTCLAQICDTNPSMCTITTQPSGNDITNQSTGVPLSAPQLPTSDDLTCSNPTYWYGVDLTSAYENWDAMSIPNRGIALAPVTNSDNNFDDFHSSTYATQACKPRLVLTYDDPDQLNIKMPLPGVGSGGGTISWEVTTEIGGRDCAWRSQGSGIEVDQAHTDYNGTPPNYRPTFFSLDFAPSEIINGQKPVHATNVPILAPANALVKAIDVNPNSPNGISIQLKFGPNNNYEIHLLHFASLQPGLAVGQTVTQGQHLGVMGSSGESEGGHLHITFLYKGQGASTVEQLTKLRMEGLILRQYQTDCTVDDSQLSKRTINSYYPSTNGS